MPCNKGKIWLDIPRLGTIKKGWEYRGYVATDNFSSIDYEQVKHTINDFCKQGYDTRIKEGRYPNRWDIWIRPHQQNLPKSKTKFIE